MLCMLPGNHPFMQSSGVSLADRIAGSGATIGIELEANACGGH
jgi:hypothetical protein